MAGRTVTLHNNATRFVAETNPPTNKTGRRSLISVTSTFAASTKLQLEVGQLRETVGRQQTPPRRADMQDQPGPQVRVVVDHAPVVADVRPLGGEQPLEVAAEPELRQRGRDRDEAGENQDHDQPGMADREQPDPLDPEAEAGGIRRRHAALPARRSTGHHQHSGAAVPGGTVSMGAGVIGNPAGAPLSHRWTGGETGPRRTRSRMAGWGTHPADESRAAFPSRRFPH